MVEQHLKRTKELNDSLLLCRTETIETFDNLIRLTTSTSMILDSLNKIRRSSVM